MANSVKLSAYINKRYERWLDYSRYHCTKNKMGGEERDVLNDVLLSLLEKDEEKLLKLLDSPKDGHTELDFFVIRMIHRNITSPSAPYQLKRLDRLINREVDFNRIDLPDNEEDEPDTPSHILSRMHEVRNALTELNLSEKAVKIFTFHFFCDEPFSNWEGKENLNELYSVYNKTKQIIKQHINKRSLF